MGEVLGAFQLELLACVHSDGCHLPTFHGVIVSKLVHHGILLSPGLVGVLNLSGMTPVIHFGRPMNGDPVKRQTSSTKTALILIESLVQDLDLLKLVIVGRLSKGNMVISIVEHMMVSRWSIIISITWIKTRNCVLDDRLRSFEPIVDFSQCFSLWLRFIGFLFSLMGRLRRKGLLLAGITSFSLLLLIFRL